MSYAPTYAPVSCLMLYLTEDCPLRCDYCFVEKKPRRMTFEVARKAVDFFLHREVAGFERSLNITFFGGEPFLELDRMEEIVAYARARCGRRITFSATTSGTIYTDRVERIVRDARMTLLLSLDGGPEASAHRPFLSGRPSYPVVARNLPRFVDCAKQLYVRMTYHPGALELVSDIEHALALGAPTVSLYPVVEADWHGSEDRLERAHQELADWYIERARGGSIPPLDVTNWFLRQLHYVRSGGTRPPRSCGVGTSLLGIDPEGHVMPCHRFLYRPQDRLGTVNSPQLSEERWKYVHLSSRDILGCDTCIAEPVCGGGCRLVALQAGYGLQGAHPSHCLLMRAQMPALQRIYDTLTEERNLPFRGLLQTSSVPHPAMTELTMR